MRRAPGLHATVVLWTLLRAVSSKHINSRSDGHRHAPVYRFELAGDPHLHLMAAALASLSSLTTALRSDLSVAAVPPQALARKPDRAIS